VALKPLAFHSPRHGNSLCSGFAGNKGRVGLASPAKKQRLDFGSGHCCRQEIQAAFIIRHALAALVISTLENERFRTKKNVLARPSDRW